MGGLFHCRGPATAGRAVSTRRPEKSREGSTAGWEGDTAGEGGGFGGKGPGAAAEGGCDAAAERPRGWSRGDMEGRTDCRAGEGDPGCPGGGPGCPGGGPAEGCVWGSRLQGNPRSAAGLTSAPAPSAHATSARRLLPPARTAHAPSPGSAAGRWGDATGRGYKR